MGIKRGYVASYKDKLRNVSVGTGKYIVRLINNDNAVWMNYDLSYEASHIDHMKNKSAIFNSFDEAKQFIDDLIKYGKYRRHNYVILRLDAYAVATNEVLNKDKCKKKRYAILYEFINSSWDNRNIGHRPMEWRAVYLGTVEGYDIKDVNQYVHRGNAHIYIYQIKNGKIVPKEGHKIPPIATLEEFRSTRADWEVDRDGVVEMLNYLKLSGSYDMIPFEWLINKNEEQEKIIKDQKIKQVKDEVLKVIKNAKC